jgi:hypothetical protein
VTTQEKAMIEVDCRVVRTEPVLGTPIDVVFSFRNVSSHSVSFSIGNGRSDSYRFTAGPDVIPLDPYYEFGGLAAIRTLGSGQQIDDDILLNKYLRFARPGHYAVNCELDLDVTDSVTGVIQAHRVRHQVDLDLKQDPARQREVLAALTADLEGPDPQKQLTASYTLSELRDLNVVPIMARGLHSRNSAVIENLLLGLGRIDADEARDALRDFASFTSSPKLKNLARQQLARPSY